MPQPLEFFDFEEADVSGTNPITLGVGPNFQANDYRVVILGIWNDNSSATFSITRSSGWSVLDSAAEQTAFARVAILYKKLQAGDTDGTATLSWVPTNVNYIAFTVRHAITVLPGWGYGGGGRPAISLPATPAFAEDGAYVIGVSTTDNAIRTPSGYTQIGASDNSGSNYNSASFESGRLLVARSVSAGSSGPSVTISTNGPANWHVGRFLIYQAPDISAPIGIATETSNTANAVSGSLLDTTTVHIGSASTEVDTANQVFTQLVGRRISPPLALPEEPITNSVISWKAVTPGSSTVTVETSVDDGQTWQLATNNGPIPRLIRGTHVAKSVRTRVSLSRVLETDPSPRVSELEVRVATDSSQEELVPLGLFTINDTSIAQQADTASGGVTVDISGVDLSRHIARQSWNDIHFIPSGTNYADAIADILENRMPGVLFNFASTEHETPRLIFGTQQGNDPWQDAQDLATAIGYELYFDPRGVATLRQVPDPAVSNVVWTLSDEDNPTVVSVTRTMSDASTFNYVVAQGESTSNSAPVMAIAVDDDPASPTYYLGDYGTVPTYFTSAMITTQAQAQEAADALLRLVKGATETVDIEFIPMPALEPGDVIEVNISGVKASGRYLIESLTIPLDPAELMTATCFRQT